MDADAKRKISFSYLNFRYDFILKTDLLEISKDILKLGLLHDSLHDEEVCLEETQRWLMFHHKLFQEFFGGYFASKCLERGLVRQ